jgi:transcriptional regulator with XRE-family HTH domain
MTGAQCKALRVKLGIKQIKLAWDCGLDSTLVSRWEGGIYRLRPEHIEAIRAYLAEQIQSAKEEIAALELPTAEVQQ